MTSVRGRSPILDGYLDELDAATMHLPADEAYETRTSIEEHLADSFPAPGRIDDDAARRVIRDLGPVSSIVPPASSTPRPSGTQLSGPKPRGGYVAAGCGAVALLAIPLIPFSVVLGLTALVLGIVALRRRHQPGFAFAGIILGVITGLVIPLALAGLYAVSESGENSPTGVTSSSAPADSSTP